MKENKFSPVKATPQIAVNNYFEDDFEDEPPLLAIMPTNFSVKSPEKSPEKFPEKSEQDSYGSNNLSFEEEVPEEAFDCSKCEEKFNSESDLMAHSIEFHDGDPGLDQGK